MHLLVCNTQYYPICFNICTKMLMLKLTFQLIQTHDHHCNYVQLTCTSVDYICISCSNMVICLTNLALLPYKGVVCYSAVGSCCTQTTKKTCFKHFYYCLLPVTVITVTSLSTAGNLATKYWDNREYAHTQTLKFSFTWSC